MIDLFEQHAVVGFILVPCDRLVYASSIQWLDLCEQHAVVGFIRATCDGFVYASSMQWLDLCVQHDVTKFIIVEIHLDFFFLTRFKEIISITLRFDTLHSRLVAV